MEISECLILKISVLLLLGFALWTGRKTCADVMSNCGQYGTDQEAKKNVTSRALFNFWIGFAAVIILVSGIFELISHELFVALLVADLTALGLKLTAEFAETRK